MKRNDMLFVKISYHLQHTLQEEKHTGIAVKDWQHTILLYLLETNPCNTNITGFLFSSSAVLAPVNLGESEDKQPGPMRPKGVKGRSGASRVGVLPELECRCRVLGCARCLPEGPTCSSLVRKGAPSWSTASPWFAWTAVLAASQQCEFQRVFKPSNTIRWRKV